MTARLQPRNVASKGVAEVSQRRRRNATFLVVLDSELEISSDSLGGCDAEALRHGFPKRQRYSRTASRDVNRSVTEHAHIRRSLAISMHVVVQYFAF